MSADVGVLLAASFGTMALGARLSGLMGAETRKGISTLYSGLVFPAMVFRGVAAIDASGVDSRLLLAIVLSKLLVVLACMGFGLRALGARALPTAAAYAMAASHSFDVTFGVPIARVLFPSFVGYIFINQVRLGRVWSAHASAHARSAPGPPVHPSRRRARGPILS